MKFYDPQKNMAYYRQKNQPVKDKQDLILERLLEPPRQDRHSERMSKFLDDMKGEKGDDGHTPIKGVDYFTDDDIEQIKKGIKKEVTPQRGIDYLLEEEMDEWIDRVTSRIPIPTNGIDGKDGKDGKDADEEKIIEAILKKIKVPKDGKDALVDIETLVKRIKKEIREEQIKEDREYKRKMGPMMGGGTLNVTTGGGGYTIETPTGTIDGSNTSFTVTKTPVYLVSDGTTYFENNGYTLSGLTITVSVPPTGYIRSFHA